jgi:hypothetical protein
MVMKAEIIRIPDADIMVTDFGGTEDVAVFMRGHSDGWDRFYSVTDAALLASIIQSMAAQIWELQEQPGGYRNAN